jgi:hypothetical protein
MIVILLSGWARSGKDTVADNLCATHGFKRVALADPLKEAVATETGLPLELFYTDAKVEPLPAPIAAYPTAKQPRDLLLEHARRARSQDPDIYARAIVNRILAERMEQVVVSDWRLLREERFLRSALPANTRFLKVRIERPGIQTHVDVTEHELDDEPMDFYICNNAGIQELNSVVNQMVQTGSFIQPVS